MRDHHTLMLRFDSKQFKIKLFLILMLLTKQILRLTVVQPNMYYFCFLFAICVQSLQFIDSTNSAVMFFIYSPTMWTFQEYLAHRYLMHRFEPIKRIHFKHHEKPLDANKIFIPMFMTLLFSVINLFPVYVLMGYRIMMVNFSSYILCYFAFEYTHWATHCIPNSKILRGPILFHSVHHVTDCEKKNVKNFGFTSATWDLVFQTCDVHTMRKKYSFLLYIPIPLLPLIIVDTLNNADFSMCVKKSR